MAKIFISTTSFTKEYLTVLESYRKGNDIMLNPFGRKIKSKELINLAKDAEGIIAGTELYDKNILEKLSKLRVISRCGVGIDNIDIDSTNKLGIKVYNTPDAPTLAVAELTIGLIIILLRKTCLMDRGIRHGKWDKKIGNLLYGKKIGIIGFGRIGKKVTQLIKPFGVEIAYTDPFVKSSKLGLKQLSLKKLLNWADIVSVHVSTNKEILGKKELKMLKKGSYLLNLSRGEVIDEKTLYILLKNSYLAGAALDVFRQEPYKGLLRNLDNIILTPHVGSYAKESRIQMEKEAVNNLLKGLEA